MLLQPLTYVWKKQLKTAFVEHFEGKLWNNESINSNYHCTKFSQLKSFFFTVVSYLLDSLQFKQYLVPFIDSGNRWEEKFVNISQDEQEKTCVGVSFFIKTPELEL